MNKTLALAHKQHGLNPIYNFMATQYNFPIIEPNIIKPKKDI